MADLKQKKPKLILHVCCIGCGAFTAKLLEREYNIILFFYNPCIYPEDEYRKRLAETKRIASRFSLSLITGEYDYPEWIKKISGHEDDPERGERCLICYRDRLKKTAKLAIRYNAEYFTTTLTISPHKITGAINDIGVNLSGELGVNSAKGGVKFLSRDFKKQDGFKKSMELSRELKLYRQTYCGCEFSIRKDHW